MPRASQVRLRIPWMLLLLALAWSVGCGPSAFAQVVDARESQVISIPRNDGQPVEIDLSRGRPTGESPRVRYREDSGGRSVFVDWSQIGDSIVWPISVAQPGRYEVILDYAAASSGVGSRFRVSCNGDAFEAELRSTGSTDVFGLMLAGSLTLRKGRSELRIQPLSIAGGELMRLRRLWLRRISAGSMLDDLFPRWHERDDWLRFAPNGWILFGFGGQFLFFLRFVVQWYVSEKHKRVVVPVVFWYISIAGSATIFVYAMHRRDIVFMTAQLLACVIYVRNLMLIYRRSAGDADALGERHAAVSEEA